MERELLNNLLDYFTDKYRLNIKTDEYGVIEIFNSGGRSLGSFNPNGYNLLRNVRELVKILEDELR